jgi:transposase
MPQARILDLRWSALLNEFRRSGLTHAEFCDRHDISIHSFRKRLYAAGTSKPMPATGGLAAANTPDFLPVTILPDPMPAVAANPQALELVLPNGRRIAVAPGFDPQTLRRLITVVEAGPCSD